jgi:hypothetical protein
MVVVHFTSEEAVAIYRRVRADLRGCFLMARRDRGEGQSG